MAGRWKISSRGLVVLIAACLLRALLPAELSGWRVHSAGGEFACRDHACGCATSEACHRACCCESGGRTAGDHGPLVRALECHGLGAGGLATQASGWVAVLPCALEWSAAPASPPSASPVRELLRGLHPEPATPPPRFATA